VELDGRIHGKERREPRSLLLLIVMQIEANRIAKTPINIQKKSCP
jgi:hypothetical protein